VSFTEKEIEAAAKALMEMPGWAALAGRPMRAKVLAAAVLAAVTESRTVTDVAGLDALADPETILVDYDGHPYQWGIDMNDEEGWMSPHDPLVITSAHLWRLKPLTVLHYGEGAGK
jgi:hypothetical protein